MTATQKNVTDEQRTGFLKLMPINRFAEADEVAAAILFLCSEVSIPAADLGGGMVAL
jgi:hypothetical protein